MLGVLGKLPVLALTGIVMVAAHIAIQVFAQGTGGHLLDFQLTGAAALATFDALKSIPNAVGVHLYISAGIDMVYPFAYSAFVGGLCMRYGAARGAQFAAPILLAAGLDIAENVSQIMALTGNPDALHAKTVLTPAKFGFAAIGSAIAIWLWARAVFIRR